MTLTRERVVAEAVALLDESGLDGVTLRKLAQRLGVQAPTLYWHVRNKAALVTEIAEVILGQELSGLEPPQADQLWPDWLAGVAGRLRRAMLNHPDGARIVSAAHLSRTMTAVSETAMKALVDQGVTLHRARLTVLAIEHLTIGHVLAEQAPRPGEEDLAGFDMEAFARDHPTVLAGITDYFQPGRTVDDLFADTLKIILGS